VPDANRHGANLKDNQMLFLIYNLIGIGSFILGSAPGEHTHQAEWNSFVTFSSCLGGPFGYVPQHTNFVTKFEYKKGCRRLQYARLIVLGATGWVLSRTWKLPGNGSLRWAAAEPSPVGAAFYFYMPLASMSNPPLNWGYPRHRPGLLPLF